MSVLYSCSERWNYSDMCKNIVLLLLWALYERMYVITLYLWMWYVVMYEHVLCTSWGWKRKDTSSISTCLEQHYYGDQVRERLGNTLRMQIV